MREKFDLDGLRGKKTVLKLCLRLECFFFLVQISKNGRLKPSQGNLNPKVLPHK